MCGEEKLLDNKKLYGRVLRNYLANPSSSDGLSAVLLYCMLLPDLLGYSLIAWGSDSKQVSIWATIFRLTFVLVKTHRIFFLLFSLKISELSRRLDDEKSWAGIFRNVIRRLVDKLSLFARKVSLRKLVNADQLNKIVQNINTIEKLKKENKTRKAIAKIIASFLKTICKHLGLERLVNKIQNILKDQKITQGVTALGPVRREIVGNARRTRGLLGFVNRLRDARIDKTRARKEKDGKERETSENRDRSKVRDWERERDRDKESAKNSLDRFKKLDHSLAQNNYSKLREQTKNILETKKNDKKTDLKTKLNEEIVTKQLTSSLSREITRDLNL
ncbi:MAG: hypothetical protein LBI29_03575, partial [Rickettsiales bacterium]|nr:hypothetical protein [Rickettsiales bacterium]